MFKYIRHPIQTTKRLADWATAPARKKLGEYKVTGSYLRQNASDMLGEIGSAMKRAEPEALQFEEFSRRLRVDPYSDAPERAARVNFCLSMVFLTICGWTVVQLTNGLFDSSVIVSVSSALALLASFTAGLGCFWRYQIFANRKYVPFYKWFKQGGSLFTILALGTTIALSSIVPQVSQALDLPTEMMISKDDDISAGIFKRLLGEAWSTIAGTRGAKVDIAQNPYTELIVSVLGTLNVAALGYLSILIMYMWGVFTAATAHEGKKLGGGVYNSLWVPTRHALSFSLMVPVLKGLSLMQVVMICCVSFSINFANIIWDKASKFISENTQENFSQMSNNLADEARQMFPKFFEASVWQLIAEENQRIADNVRDGVQRDINDPTIYDYPKAYREINAPTDETGNPVCEKETTKGGYLTIITCGSGLDKKITMYGTPVKGLDDTDLGYAEHLSSDSKSSVVLEAKKQATITTYEAARQHAKNYLTKGASLDSKYGYHGPQSIETKDFSSVVNAYSSTVREKTAEVVKNYLINNDDLRKKVSKSIDYDGKGSKHGWITAGLYSYILAVLQKTIDDLSYSSSSYTPPNMKKLKEVAAKRWDGDSRQAFTNSSAYFSQNISTNVHYSSTTLDSKDPNIILKPLRKAVKFLILDSNSQDAGTVGIAASVLAKLSQGNPTVVIQAIGDRLIEGGCWALGASAALQVGGSLLAKFAGIMGDAINSVGGFFYGILMLAGIAMLAVGLIMAYIMPITPLIFWLKACLNWIFQVLIALVAAPFWVCVHAMPKGEGLAGDQARQGYLFLIDMAIRPTLLTCGAIFALSVEQVAGWLFYTLFNMWFINTSVYLNMGILADITYTVVILSAMYTLIITVWTKGITFLPENAMRWAGNSNSFSGDNDMHQEVTRTFGAFSSTAQQSIGQSMRSMPGGQGKLPGGGGGGGGDDKGGGGGAGQAAQHIAKKGGEAGAGAASAAGSAGASAAGSSAAGSSAAGAGGGTEGAGKQIASKDEVSGGGGQEKGSGGDSGGNTDILSPRASMGMDDEATKKKLKIAGDAMSGGGASAAGSAGGGIAGQIGGKIG